MRKRIAGVILVLTAFVSLFYIFAATNKVRADAAPDLLSAPQLSVQQSADVPSLPSSLNGNVDCIQDGPYDCVVDTMYGKFSSNGFVKRNKTKDYYQLISNIDNRAHSIAIPSSNTIINYTTEPPYGFYLYFTKDFASSVSTTKIYGTSVQQYQINRLYDGKLSDKAKHRLAADYASMSFSPNGQWMVVSMPNVAMLRVNLDTFEVTPFASGFNYTIGLDPAVKTAITNDGRYAVLASKTFGRFEIYDLNTCAGAPETINGPVTCPSRNLQSLMQTKIPGYISVGQVRFVGNNTLRLYADYNNGAGHKIAPFTINPQGAGIHGHDYLSLGDSYISGEGAYNYLEGTDTAGNRCHVSILSYSYLLAHDLSYNSFHSVACSGAHIDDIIDTSENLKSQSDPKTTRKQFNDSDKTSSIISNFQPGYIDQLDFVTTYHPQVITLSVGGNDVGFKDILQSCVAFWNIGTCYNTYEDRLELVRQINAQFPNLVSAYQTLKNASPPDTRIYVIGYPQIVKPGGDCQPNVQLNADELVFAQQFTSYLDSVIQQAAAKAGVYYVDTQSAFNGHRLCEGKSGKVAVNGLTLGHDFPKIIKGFIQGPLADETYHPTPLGYSLLKDVVKAATNNLSTPMPAPNVAAAPAETGLDILNVAHTGRSINSTNYEDSLSSDILPRGTVTDILLSGLDYSLKPLTNYRVELHSTPVVLGNFTTSSDGNLSSQITIPSSVPAGFHTLHVYGTNVAGEPIDIYKSVYVAASASDYNGDGIPNSTDPCVFIAPSGQDFDQDGIDDACDGLISETLPAPPPPPVPGVLAVPSVSIGAPANNNTLSQDPTTPVADGTSLNNIFTQIFTSPSFSPMVVSQTSSSLPTFGVTSANSFDYNGSPTANITPAQPTTQPPKGTVLSDILARDINNSHKSSARIIIILASFLLIIGLGAWIFRRIIKL